MTNRDVIQDGWKSEAVKESLDLCLACKGCKSDCPTGVDVATYKSEFLAHYYETNRRPLNALAFANIDLWARAASHVPGLVNLATQLPGLSTLAKMAGGISPHRRIPRFAPETFQQWWENRLRVGTGLVPIQARHSPTTQFDRSAGVSPAVERASRPLTQVLLWADTFNNHFQPSTPIAAAKVLEAAGFDVLVPRAHLCCGRPLYDLGPAGPRQGITSPGHGRTLRRNRAAHSRAPGSKTKTVTAILRIVANAREPMGRGPVGGIAPVNHIEEKDASAGGHSALRRDASLASFQRPAGNWQPTANERADEL